MPGRRAKPPRLYQLRDGFWIIRDRGRFIRTGCKGGGADQVARAADKLADYIGARHTPRLGERNPDRLPIADILVAYADAKIPPAAAFAGDPRRIRRHGELINRLEILNEFFGDKIVGAIVSQTCRDFVAWRMGSLGERAGFPAARRPVTAGSARRELEDLRAAINLYHADYRLNAMPKITLPAKASAVLPSWVWPR